MNNEPITLSEVQQQADEWIRTYGEQSFKQGEEPNLAEEMADVLWVLVCMANQTGVDLTEAWRHTIEKKTKRDKTRHLENEKLKAPSNSPQGGELKQE